jgi:hypothetical protein
VHQPSSSKRSSPLCLSETAGYTGRVTYELWSKASRSVLGAFDSEAEALAAVREALAHHGRAYAEELAVVREDRRGHSNLLAEGIQLVDRATAAAARSHRLTA